MFQHPSHTAQFAADRRLARQATASRRRNRRRGPITATAGEGTAGAGRVAAGRADPAGFQDAGVDVAAVVRLARRRGIGTSLAEIVADPAHPDVARERALGRLLAVLAAAGRTTNVATDRAA